MNGWQSSFLIWHSEHVQFAEHCYRIFQWVIIKLGTLYLQGSRTTLYTGPQMSSVYINNVRVFLWLTNFLTSMLNKTDNNAYFSI